MIFWVPKYQFNLILCVQQSLNCLNNILLSSVYGCPSKWQQTPLGKDCDYNCHKHLPALNQRTTRLALALISFECQVGHLDLRNIMYQPSPLLSADQALLVADSISQLIMIIASMLLLMVKCCHLASIILGSYHSHCYEGALFESAGTATTEPVSDAYVPFPRTFQLSSSLSLLIPNFKKL